MARKRRTGDRREGRRGDLGELIEPIKWAGFCMYSMKDEWIKIDQLLKARKD